MAAKNHLTIECVENTTTVPGVPSKVFWYHIKARNGKILLTSETYPTRAHTVRAATKLKTEFDESAEKAALVIPWKK